MKELIKNESIICKNTKYIDLTKLSKKELYELLYLINVYKIELTPVIFNQQSFTIICDCLLDQGRHCTLSTFKDKIKDEYSFEYDITEKMFINACEQIIQTINKDVHQIFELLYLMRLCNNYKYLLTPQQYDIICNYLIDMSFDNWLATFTNKYSEYKYKLYEKNNFLNKFYNTK